MGLEKVKEDVLEKAREEADKLIAEGRTEARRIHKSAEEEIKLKKKKTWDKITKLKEALMTKAVSSAELETKKEILNAKKDVLDSIFERVKMKLADIPADKRNVHMTKLLERAKRELDVATIYCSEKDAKLVSGYAVKPTSILGGLIAENNDGSVRLELSYDSLIEMLYQELIKEISGILFIK